MAKKSFYYCLAENGEAPTVKHQTYNDAKAEAIRIMNITGKSVEILECCSKIIPINYKVEVYESSDLPF